MNMTYIRSVFIKSKYTVQVVKVCKTAHVFLVLNITKFTDKVRHVYQDQRVILF